MDVDKVEEEEERDHITLFLQDFFNNWKLDHLSTNIVRNCKDILKKQLS